MSEPAHYLSYREFCDTVLAVMKEQGTDVDARQHPEDVEIMLTAFMRSFAAGMTEAIHRQAKR